MPRLAHEEPCSPQDVPGCKAVITEKCSNVCPGYGFVFSQCFCGTGCFPCCSKQLWQCLTVGLHQPAFWRLENQLQSWCPELWRHRTAAGSVRVAQPGREAARLCCAGGQESLHCCAPAAGDVEEHRDAGTARAVTPALCPQQDAPRDPCATTDELLRDGCQEDGARVISVVPSDDKK